MYPRARPFRGLALQADQASVQRQAQKLLIKHRPRIRYPTGAPPISAVIPAAYAGLDVDLASGVHSAVKLLLLLERWNLGPMEATLCDMC